MLSSLVHFKANHFVRRRWFWLLNGLLLLLYLWTLTGQTRVAVTVSNGQCNAAVPGRIIYARDLGDRQNARLLALYPERTPYRLVDRSLIPLH